MGQNILTSNISDSTGDDMPHSNNSHEAGITMANTAIIATSTNNVVSSNAASIDTPSANALESAACAEEWDRLFGKGFRLDPVDRTPVGEALRLSKPGNLPIRYTPAMGYIAYDGTHWVPANVDAKKIVLDYHDSMLREADKAFSLSLQWAVSCGLTDSTGEAISQFLKDSSQIGCIKAMKAAQSYRDYALQSHTAKRVAETVRALRSLIRVESSRLDKDCYLLNTPEATYDLRMGLAGAKEHNPDELITKLTACSPSDEGEAIWEDALNTFFRGDAELTRYAKRVFGAACLGNISPKSVIALCGFSGGGKSTFMEAISKVLGSYSSTTTSIVMFVADRKFNLNWNAMTRGQRLLMTPDMDEATGVGSCIKQMHIDVGAASARVKGGQLYSYEPCRTFVGEVNYNPVELFYEMGKPEGVYVIPFLAKIGMPDARVNYGAYLAKAAGGAIMKWLIEGAQEAYEAGFNIPDPKCVQNLIEEANSIEGDMFPLELCEDPGAKDN